MNSSINQLLNLPGTTVKELIDVEGYICIYLEMIDSSADCPHCGQSSQEMRQNRPIIIRDLPAFGREILLKVPRRQFYCRCCQRYFTESLDFLDAHRHHTKRYEVAIYERIGSTTIEQVSREEHLSVDEIKGIFDFIWLQRQEPQWSEVKRLSMDEVAMRKGHQNFVGVVSDIDAKTLLEVVPSHCQEDLLESLGEQALQVREQVKEVSVDMWGGFPKVIKELFPNAVIVFDRFHVVKGVNKELNKIRREEGITDRGSKYVLLKNFEDLSEEQEEELFRMLCRSNRLKESYLLKEELRDIYETRYSVEEGKLAIKEWLEKADNFYYEAAQTIRKHLEGVCNYFISRTTSGFMEGLNNRIQLIKRQAYGFGNFDNFRSRLLAALS